jgi:hypothetical protein
MTTLRIPFSGNVLACIFALMVPYVAGCHGGARYQGTVVRAPDAQGPGFAFGPVAADASAAAPVAGASVSLCQCLEEKPCACDSTPDDAQRVLASRQVTTDANGKFDAEIYAAVPLAGTLVYILAVRAKDFEPFMYKRRADAAALHATEPTSGQAPLTIRLRPLPAAASPQAPTE